tara:strand:- start:64 stop:1152 length:1089 start_codon:yes stop_codon:yes gene_type:complete
MKYTSKIERKSGGTSWVFKPPQDAATSGIVKTQTFRDGRTARVEIPKLIDKVDAYRRGEIVAGNIGKMSNLAQIIGHYFKTKHFNSLSQNTYKNYTSNLACICRTQIYGKELGTFRVSHLTVPVCTKMYDTWEDDVSTNNANEYARVFSMIMNYCVALGIVNDNPMKHVSKRTHEPASVVWTDAEVEKFCDVAFSDFKFRNIGLSVLMAYEWGQRPTDIYNLKWENVEFDKDMVKIRQSKRGARVELPLEEPLTSLLKQQHNDWDFQQYVAPQQRSPDGVYRAYTTAASGPLFREVKALAGLPDHLKVGHLRKTTINQLIESGVDHLAIMSVTGHKNVSSLNAYVKHNLETAKSALSRRNKK